MRVALIHDWLTGMRGGEKVLEELAALYPEAPIYTLIHFPGSVSPALESHPIHTSFLQRAPLVRSRYRSYLPFFPAAIEDFDFRDYDLLLSTSHCVAKGVIPGPSTLHICYCHSPMRYAWDQEHTYFPKRRGLGARLRNLALTGLRLWDVASVPRVNVFMANSTFVAQRIRRFYDRDAEVVPPPVDIDFYMPSYSENNPQSGKNERPGGMNDKTMSDDGYDLAVSALAPYKRLELAIEACEKMGRELRIVGTGPEEKRLRSLAGPRTRFLGRVDSDELRRLYQGARLFLQPGIEDFGIAPVEALAAGTPVVACGEGGVLDIVENGVQGVLYRGQNAGALAAAIDKAGEIRFNSEKLASRAKSFSKTLFRQRVSSLISRYVANLEGVTP